MALHIKISVSLQYRDTEVELETERVEAARQLLAELKRLYLQVGEPWRAKVRVQLNQQRRQRLTQGEVTSGWMVSVNRQRTSSPSEQIIRIERETKG